MSRATWYRYGKPEKNLNRIPMKEAAKIAGVSIRQAERMLRIARYRPDLWERVQRNELKACAAEQMLIADETARIVEYFKQSGDLRPRPQGSAHDD